MYNYPVIQALVYHAEAMLLKKTCAESTIVTWPVEIGIIANVINRKKMNGQHLLPEKLKP